MAPPDDRVRLLAPADLYERIGEPLTAQCISPAFEMVGGLAGGAEVLDVACGPGALSVAAAELGARVTAVDVSEDMVARAAQRLARYPSCTATVMDAQVLEFDDATFDATFSMFGVINLPDWGGALREMVRVTRPGGHGCISSWTDPRTVASVGLLVEAMAEVFPERETIPRPAGVLLAAEPDALREGLEGAGFRDVTVRAVQVVWEVPSVEGFLAELDQFYGFMPPYLGLTADERDRLTPALRAAAYRRAGSDGKLRATTTAHLAAGRV